jgi:hypothetical protein
MIKHPKFQWRVNQLTDKKSSSKKTTNNKATKKKTVKKSSTPKKAAKISAATITLKNAVLKVLQRSQKDVQNKDLLQRVLKSGYKTTAQGKSFQNLRYKALTDLVKEKKAKRVERGVYRLARK